MVFNPPSDQDLKESRNLNSSLVLWSKIQTSQLPNNSTARIVTELCLHFDSEVENVKR